MKNIISIIKVKGNSMNRFLFEGEKVIIAKQKRYSLGDVVAFENDGKIIIHRIIFSFCSIKYQFGDNSFAGSWINKEVILGKVVSAKNNTAIMFKMLNVFCAIISLLTLLLLKTTDTKMELLRKRIFGKIYLALLNIRNQLQKFLRKFVFLYS